MTINLQDIRNAVVTYVDNKVNVSISTLLPTGGNEINPNEEFSFTITAKNAIADSGGIPLKDIIWRIWVENEAVGKLTVPTGITARSGLSTTSTLLPAGTLVREMYLFPSSIAFLPDDPKNYLGVGDSDTISLKGRAMSNPSGGSSNIKFKIYADIDMDWLFPKDQDSSIATRALVVKG